ncbi:TBC1 domain family member 25-like [Stegodyphus dumicola]|uniref:TBC1 domain family member 25-like n=1 Tax=Stegodyphus dumicola TaxID=202533 RepID=UPI0015A9A776|nr:TBC1 domain family member 25-like [Stegodyphus dumicola]
MLKVQRAFSFESYSDERERPPLDEIGYNSLLDQEGRVVNHRELHMAVYKGGVEPAMRPTVWKHLLNVFPHGMTLEERNSYLNSKSEEYYRLRYRWQHLIQSGTVPDVLQDITNLVRKDVRRTDRTEKFYSGSDDNENVRALFNILTTYAVNHPSVSYCQGMSDLLSPILYVMKKESHAYICFCGLMKRAQTNFKLDGRSMKIKFRHLQKMLKFYDRELYCYMKEQGALDLLFCYRWILLDLKREFPYNEMLSMMEVLWGSLPPKPPHKELDLYEVKFPTAAICNSLKERTNSLDYFRFCEDHFGNSHDTSSLSHSTSNTATSQALKKWALRVRRESIARNIESHESSSEEEIKLPLHYRKRKFRSYITGKLGRLNNNRQIPAPEWPVRSCRVPKRRNSLVPEICQSWSCGEVFEEKPEITDALYDARDFLRNQWCYSNTVNEIQLNNWLNGRHFGIKECAVGSKDDDSIISESNSRQRHGSSDSNYSTISEEFSDAEDENLEKDTSPRTQRSRSEGYSSDIDSKEASTLADDDDYDSEEDEFEDYSDDEFIDSMDGRQFEEVESYFDRKKEMLPPPHILGDGNPFLLFLCITMIMQHKTEILNRKLDFNELAIYFDKLVRKHRLCKVLRKAQKLFKDYLNMGWDAEDKDDGEESEP